MMDQNQEKKRKKIGARVFWILALLLSLSLHLFFLRKLGDYKPLETNSSLPKDYVKLKFLPEKTPLAQGKKAPEEKKPEDDFNKKIVEAPLKKTERPPEFDYLGQNDHKAEKQMKLKNRPDSKAADPGLQKGIKEKTKDREIAQDKNQDQKKADDKDQPQSMTKKGTVSNKDNKEKELAETNTTDSVIKKGVGDLKKRSANGKNAYENLLAQSMKKMENKQEQAGYADYINDKIEEGDTIDLNTHEYRFIGYFTGLRKAIELVWVYPSEAAHRGVYGQVNLKFIIEANGKVSKIQVVESSGHAVLDQAIVDAIRLASPFAPLPKGFQKDKLIVKGNFTYVLNSF